MFPPRFAASVLFACLACGIIASSIAQQIQPLLGEPFVITPKGISTLRITNGLAVPGVKLWTSFAGMVEGVDVVNGSARFEVSPPIALSPGIAVARLCSERGVSSWLRVAVTSQKLTGIAVSNHTQTTALKLTAPVMLAGHCPAQQSAWFQFNARRGQTLTFDIVAGRLGLPLDPFIRLVDGHGRELIGLDDSPGAGIDPVLEYRFIQGGPYFLEVRDARHGGGPGHRFLLNLSEHGSIPSGLAGSVPDFAVEELSGPKVSDSPTDNDPGNAVSLPLPAFIEGHFDRPGDRDHFRFSAEKDQRVVFHGTTRSIGSPCDLALAVCSLDGRIIAESNATGADEGALTNRFSEAGAYLLRVEELNQQGGPGLRYEVAAMPYRAGFTLSCAVEKAETSPGETFELKITAVRTEFDGPIAIQLIGDATDLTLNEAAIPEKKSEATFKVQVSKSLPPGTLRHFGVQGTARIGEAEFKARASTRPALRQLWPQTLHPPRELDGLIALGIKSAASK